jgi:hypothetical protein
MADAIDFDTLCENVGAASNATQALCRMRQVSVLSPGREQNADELSDFHDHDAMETRRTVQIDAAQRSQA